MPERSDGSSIDAINSAGIYFAIVNCIYISDGTTVDWTGFDLGDTRATEPFPKTKTVEQ